MIAAQRRRGPAMALDWWGRGLRALAGQLTRGVLPQEDWPAAVAELCAAVPAEVVLAGFDLSRLQARRRSFGPGEHRIAACLPEQPPDAVLAVELVLLTGRQAVPPHGRNNLAAAQLVLSGGGRQLLYDRVADVPGAVLLLPAADRLIGPGSCFGGSERDGNVRWLLAGPVPLVMVELTVPIAGGGRFRHPCCRDGRLYLDPTGPVGTDGLIPAPLLEARLAQRIFRGAP